MTVLFDERTIDCKKKNLNESQILKPLTETYPSSHFVALQTAQYTLTGTGEGGACVGTPDDQKPSVLGVSTHSKPPLSLVESTTNTAATRGSVPSSKQFNFIYFVLKTEILFVVTVACDLCRRKMVRSRRYTLRAM